MERWWKERRNANRNKLRSRSSILGKILEYDMSNKRKIFDNVYDERENKQAKTANVCEVIHVSECSYTPTDWQWLSGTELSLPQNCAQRQKCGSSHQGSRSHHSSAPGNCPVRTFNQWMQLPRTCPSVLMRALISLNCYKGEGAESRLHFPFTIPLG